LMRYRPPACFSAGARRSRVPPRRRIIVSLAAIRFAASAGQPHGRCGARSCAAGASLPRLYPLLSPHGPALVRNGWTRNVRAAGTAIGEDPIAAAPNGLSRNPTKKIAAGPTGV